MKKNQQSDCPQLCGHYFPCDPCTALEDLKAAEKIEQTQCLDVGNEVTISRCPTLDGGWEYCVYDTCGTEDTTEDWEEALKIALEYGADDLPFDDDPPDSCEWV